jgi:hypothetical protein
MCAVSVHPTTALLLGLARRDALTALQAYPCQLPTIRLWWQQPLPAQPKEVQQQQHLHLREHLQPQLQVTAQARIFLLSMAVLFRQQLQPQLQMTAQALRILLLSMAVLLWVAVSLPAPQAQQVLAGLQR